MKHSKNICFNKYIQRHSHSHMTYKTLKHVSLKKLKTHKIKTETVCGNLWHMGYN